MSGTTARVVRIELTKRAVKTGTIRTRLATADIVFFTGGDVERGMQLVDDRDLAAYIRELAASGKPMEGISAGAILLGRHWIRFPEQREPERFECLGVVPASFDTHGEDDDWSELRELARKTRDERSVFGIPSHGAAIWDGTLGEPLARFACGRRPRMLRGARAIRLVPANASP